VLALWFIGMTGCCQREKTGEKRPFNAGNANSALTVTDGLLVLTYTDGDPCHHVDANRSSVITFVCAAGNETDPTTSLGRPHFVNEDDCTYKFTWPTTLACPHTVSFMQVNNNYVIRVIVNYYHSNELINY